MYEKVAFVLEPLGTEVIFSVQKLWKNIENAVRPLEIPDPAHSNEDYHHYQICSAMALPSSGFGNPTEEFFQSFSCLTVAELLCPPMRKVFLTSS